MRRNIDANGGLIVTMSRRTFVLTLAVSILSIGIVVAVVSLLVIHAGVMNANAAGSRTYVKSGDGTQKSVTTTITWYGYNDNSGQTEAQHGSADIAYAKSGGYPTVHNQAHEGTGTYADPVTFAAPNKDLKSSFPIGSIIYVPLVKKYFIMEDQCGDNDPQGCQNGANHADLWMGPAQAMDGNKLDACEGNATPNSAANVTINPSASLAVDTTIMYTSNNQCTVKLYSNAAPLARLKSAAAAAPATPTVSAAITAASTLKTSSRYVKSGNGKQKSVSTKITWYGYNDNTDKTGGHLGSSYIAYPKSGGYPTVHNQAHEGTGTYTDPVTFAAPSKDLKSSFPIGSIIYVPLFKKYFIMEDKCADNSPSGCQDGANHANLWMGPTTKMNGTKLNACEWYATPDAAVDVTINPSSSLAVDTTKIYTSGNKCTVKFHSGTQITANAISKSIATGTPEPVATGTSKSVVTSSKYVKSGNGAQKSVTTTVTWYGYNDNSGQTEAQYGSADIAYPKNGGYPTVHNQAHEGTGTYTDPITFAAPNKDLTSSFPIGSIIYVPLVKKYFIMEDQCGDTDPQGCQNGTNHADLWMGPAQAMDGNALGNCEGNATPNSAVSVMINPSPSLAVDTTIMYTSDNKCTIKLYN